MYLYDNPKPRKMTTQPPPFFMKRVGSRVIRIPTHWGLGTAYSKPYDERYRRAWRARQRGSAAGTAPTTQPNPGAPFGLSWPVLLLVAVVGYGWWKGRSTAA